MEEKTNVQFSTSGVRLPMLVISPFAKSNFVDGTLTDQTSAIRFIEDDWDGLETIRSTRKQGR
jgi:phospholipase C